MGVRNEAQEEEMRKRGFILPNEAAEQIKVHVSVIYRAIKDGKLKSAKVADRLYIELASFNEYAGPLAKEK